jgi:hypothetical protein
VNDPTDPARHTVPAIPDRPIVAGAIAALRDLGVTDYQTARTALDSWARVDQLTDHDTARVLFAFIDHPDWCAKLPSEPDDESHATSPIPINLDDRDELIGLTINLQQAWPPFESYVRLWLHITEDSVTTDYPISAGQGRALQVALGALLALAREVTS